MTASEKPSIDIERALSERLTVHQNLAQEILIVPVDRIRLCLLAHRDWLASRREWAIPLGIFVTVLTAWLVTDFRDRLLSAAVWEALFLLIGGVAFLWFAIAGIRAIAMSLKGTAGGVDGIIAELKAPGPAEMPAGEAARILDAMFAANRTRDASDRASRDMRRRNPKP
jgi:hypothetical protein